MLRESHALKNLALPARLHLLLPASLRLSLADRSIDEPAETSKVEFPRRAASSCLQGTLLYHPAGSAFLTRRLLQGEQEQELTLNMYRNVPPPLLKTLHCFYRVAQKPCQLALALSEITADVRKFFFLHFWITFLLLLIIPLSGTSWNSASRGMFDVIPRILVDLPEISSFQRGQDPRESSCCESSLTMLPQCGI